MEFKLFGPIISSSERGAISIGQEHFDLCFCEFCPLPKVVCKHLSFSLEAKLKKGMTIDLFKKELESLKEIKQVERERTKTESRIKELKEQINEIDKRIYILEEKQRKNNIEQTEEIEKKINQLKNEELKMIEKKITEIQDKYKVLKDPLVEEIWSIDAKLKDKGGFLSPLFRVNKKDLQGKRLGLTKKIHAIDSQMPREIEQAKLSISGEMAKEQLKLEGQLQAILETPKIKKLKGEKNILKQLMAELLFTMRKMDEGIRKLGDLISIFVSQSACSLRVEPLSTDLKECENCKDKVPIEKIPCAGDEVVLEKDLRK